MISDDFMVSDVGRENCGTPRESTKAPPTSGLPLRINTMSILMY